MKIFQQELWIEFRFSTMGVHEKNKDPLSTGYQFVIHMRLCITSTIQKSNRI